MTVGAVVTAAAAVLGAGPCAGPPLDPALPVAADDVCYHMVRTMAEEAGLLAAAFTAILALTVVGLIRMASAAPAGRAERIP